MSLRIRSLPTVLIETNAEVSKYKVTGVAVAWIGDQDVGSLHYELVIGGIGKLSFMQVDEEHRGLGVGKEMYMAVENLAKNYHVKKLILVVGIPGYGDPERAKDFWEEKGFTITDGRAEKQLGNSESESSNPTQYGTCYEDAWRFLIKEEDGSLIHGSLQLSEEGGRVNHAWVELPTGFVYEPQTKTFFSLKDLGIFSPIEEHRYTSEQAAIMVARTGNMGPWTDEERSMWL